VQRYRNGFCRRRIFGFLAARQLVALRFVLLLRYGVCLRPRMVALRTRNFPSVLLYLTGLSRRSLVDRWSLVLCPSRRLPGNVLHILSVGFEQAGRCMPFAPSRRRTSHHECLPRSAGKNRPPPVSFQVFLMVRGKSTPIIRGPTLCHHFWNTQTPDVFHSISRVPPRFGKRCTKSSAKVAQGKCDNDKSAPPPNTHARVVLSPYPVSLGAFYLCSLNL